MTIIHIRKGEDALQKAFPEDEDNSEVSDDKNSEDVSSDNSIVEVHEGDEESVVEEEMFDYDSDDEDRNSLGTTEENEETDCAYVNLKGVGRGLCLQILQLWANRFSKYAHDWAVAGWLLSVKEEIQEDAKKRNGMSQVGFRESGGCNFLTKGGERKNQERSEQIMERVFFV